MRITGLLVLCAGLLAAGPVAAGLFDDDVARKQIAEQQKRVDELRQQTEGIGTRLSRVEEDAKAQPFLAMAAEIEKLREEIRALRGLIEVLGNNIENVSKRQRDMYVDLDLRLRRFEQPDAAVAPAGSAPVPPVTAAPATPATSGGEPPKASTSAVPSPTDEGDAYERAQAQRRAGNYQGAIAAFQELIKKYPKSTWAPRAQYWIGDSYFNLRDFKSAITNQQKLVATYPDSTSVPDALLNMASSQLESGDGAMARKTMDGLVAKYPSSDAAEKARRRLASPR